MIWIPASAGTSGVGLADRISRAAFDQRDPHLRHAEVEQLCRHGVGAAKSLSIG